MSQRTARRTWHGHSWRADAGRSVPQENYGFAGDSVEKINFFCHYDLKHL